MICICYLNRSPQGKVDIYIQTLDLIDSVPYSVKVAGHHGDAQTNKPTKRDDRVCPLISPLHNADKASAGPPIGLNLF